MWWRPRPFRQLDEIQKSLSSIERKLNTMAGDVRALDEALDTLTTDVANLKTAVEALIAAIPQGDLTEEIQRVQAAFTSVEQVTSEATQATLPPA
jgi:uncharacterized protein YoxC